MKPNLFAVCLIFAAIPSPDRACACGCGIYDVGTSSMFPRSAGASAFLEDDFQDQNSNWSGSSRAPAANNPDKDIRTNFLTAGIQDMFSRSWGLQFEVPHESRGFKTTGGAGGDDRVALSWSGVGDIRVEGIYSGFSPDLSTGATFGLKLPTGSYTHNDAFGDIDRDTEIGSGSTDLLLGGFHRGSLTNDNRWIWFVQAELDLPVATRDQYRPGAEIDSAAGIYFSGWSARAGTVTPVAQVKVSKRTSDSGANAANPVASGFQRVLVAPGVEIDLHPVMLYADVELPVYQHFTGNQLAATALFKVTLSVLF